MNDRYREILNQRVRDTWHNWTESEKKARADKAAYDVALREMCNYENGMTIKDNLSIIESKGGTI
jgi:hypothetical protein